MPVAIRDEQEAGDGEALLMVEFWLKNKDNGMKEKSCYNHLSKGWRKQRSTFRVDEVWWEMESLLSLEGLPTGNYKKTQ